VNFRNFFKTNAFLILAFLLVFLAGWQAGYAGFQFSLKFNPPGITIENKAPRNQTVDFSLMWEVIERINADYLFRPVDGAKLLYGAVSGMIQALGDPYTSFLDPTQNQEFADGLSGVYEGIGAEIGIREDQLIIVAPLDGSPAKSAGLRAGDKLLEIDGGNTTGITVTAAVAKIRGEAGTTVKLKLQRGTVAPYEVTITRAQIKVESVSWEDKGNGLVLIELTRFGDGTTDEWDSAIAQIKSQVKDVKGVVLDLRSNPGGYLQAAVYIASEFLKDGVVVLQEDSRGDRATLSVQATKSNHALAGKKLVILIDGGSASASEILAGALSERAGATLVGEKSFGKGTVQDAVDFQDGSGLHLTVAKWLTPKGFWVHDKGIEPGYKVELTDEDLNSGRDPQLVKALDILK